MSQITIILRNEESEVSLLFSLSLKWFATVAFYTSFFPLTFISFHRNSDVGYGHLCIFYVASVYSHLMTFVHYTTQSEETLFRSCAAVGFNGNDFTCSVEHNLVDSWRAGGVGSFSLRRILLHFCIIHFSCTANVTFTIRVRMHTCLILVWVTFDVFRHWRTMGSTVIDIVFWNWSYGPWMIGPHSWRYIQHFWTCWPWVCFRYNGTVWPSIRPTGLPMYSRQQLNFTARTVLLVLQILMHFWWTFLTSGRSHWHVLWYIYVIVVLWVIWLYRLKTGVHSRCASRGLL